MATGVEVCVCVCVGGGGGGVSGGSGGGLEGPSFVHPQTRHFLRLAPSHPCFSPTRTSTHTTPYNSYKLVGAH